MGMTTSGSSTSIIDVDIHERADVSDLIPYLDPKWDFITQANWQPDRAMPYTQPTTGGLDRADAILPDGRPGGSDLGMLQEQLLDKIGHERGILTGWLNAGALHPGWPEFKTALMTAYNDWQIENWLDKEERLVGSIHINPNDPQGAVQEIERLGSHPKMVQVMMYIGPAETAYGEPQYHPIYEAAVRHNLVVSIHHSENSPTALGFHRYFIEWHTAVPQIFMSEMISLIFNGVFDKYPELKVIMVEGGFSYVPHLMWKTDQQYRELRIEVPWVKRLPSDIIRSNFRFSSQPIEEFTAEQLDQIINQMGSDELICYSTDYPHWDYDSPTEALPADLSDDLKRKIFSENARKIYQRLPAPKEAATR